MNKNEKSLDGEGEKSKGVGSAAGGARRPVVGCGIGR